MKHKATPAFTLTEVLLSMGLITLMASVVLPMVLRVTGAESDKAKWNQTVGLLSQAYADMTTEGISDPTVEDFFRFVEKSSTPVSGTVTYNCQSDLGMYPSSISSKGYDYTNFGCSASGGSASTPYVIKLKNGAILVANTLIPLTQVINSASIPTYFFIDPDGYTQESHSEPHYVLLEPSGSITPLPDRGTTTATWYR
jgi:type II secretory pathway pseudopilin PulG